MTKSRLGSCARASALAREVVDERHLAEVVPARSTASASSPMPGTVRLMRTAPPMMR